MDAPLLIDLILQDVARLLATVATSGALHERLDGVGDQLTLHLSEELTARGHSTKVIADLLGYSSPHAYRRRKRLLLERRREDWTDSDTTGTLRQAILAHIARQPSSREDVLVTFRTRDERTVRGLLKDLVDHGLLEARTDGRLHVTPTEGSPWRAEMADLVSVLIAVHGPVSITRLQELVGDRPVDETANALLTLGRVALDNDGNFVPAEQTYCMWPASAGELGPTLVDHHVTVTDALIGVVQKRVGAAREEPTELASILTCFFDLYSDGPNADELYRELSDTLAKMYAREQARTPAKEGPRAQLRLYCGVREKVATEED